LKPPLDAVIRLLFSDDRFAALSGRSRPEIQSFGFERLLSLGPDVRCGCDVCLTCGLSRLMQMQRNFPSRDNQVSQPEAAAQHSFPKAAIEIVQIGRNPNRSFAARVIDVSHAGRSCPSTISLLLG
jgi:hypothetical protein